MPNLPQGWFSDADIAVYRDLVENIPYNGVLVELGCWKGRSLCSVADIIHRKRLTVIAVDTFEGSVNEEHHKEEVSKISIENEFKKNISAAGIYQNVKIIKGDCNETTTFSEVLFTLEKANKKADLVFIDAEHTYDAVKKSLTLWDFADVIAGHDYSDYWPEVKKAVNEYGAERGVSDRIYVRTNNSDIWYFVKPTVSVIIPTWQGASRVYPLLASIDNNTTSKKYNVEVIVVNNNPNNPFVNEVVCSNVLVVGAEQFEQKGFAPTCNYGAEIARGNYLIFLNDDCIILDYAEPDVWLDRLIAPLENLQIGVTGVMTNRLQEANFDFLVGFCLATRAGIFSDYKFTPRGWGGFEDAEFCFRVHCAGLQVLNVNTDNTYPIYHEAEGTMHDEEHREEWQTKQFRQNYNTFINDMNKVFYIITPCTRPENLDVIGDSIAQAFSEVGFAHPVWIVVPNAGAVVDESYLSKFPFMSLHPYNQPSPYGNAARRHGLAVVKGVLNGAESAASEYVYFQDDDNTFSPDIIKAAYASNHPVTLIKQVKDNGETKSIPSLPIVQGEIDTAMILVDAQTAIRIGWQSDAYEADTHYASKLTQTVGSSGADYVLFERRTYINTRLICSYNSIEFAADDSVTVVIPTKDRYSTTFALTLQAVINQTHVPKEILIYDDSTSPVDIREWESYKFLLLLANKKGIKWELIYAPKLGAWASHDHSIRRASCPLIWRVDDDCIPEPTTLAGLVAAMTPDAAAVGGHIINVDSTPIEAPEGLKNQLAVLNTTPNLQWFKPNGKTIEVEHLYSSFLYKKMHAADFHFPPLSKVSFREETMLSLWLSKKGKLLVVPVLTWHAAASNGIRSEGNNQTMYDSDEKEFKRFLVSEGFDIPNSKVFYAANGKGDAEILRTVVEEYAATGGTPIVCCTDNNVDVFNDTFITFDSYQSGMLGYGNVGDYNIYNFLNERKWTKGLKEAYKAFFI